MNLKIGFVFFLHRMLDRRKIFDYTLTKDFLFTAIYIVEPSLAKTTTNIDYI